MRHDLEQTVTVKQAAVSLGVTPSTVYKTIAKGNLPTRLVNRRVRIPVVALQAYRQHRRLGLYGSKVFRAVQDLDHA